MRKKILLLLTFFSLIAVAGGIYLAYSYDRTLSDFRNIIQLHHIENLRVQLLRNIQKVEIDLYSQSTLHPQSGAAIEADVREIEKSIVNCYSCHHEPEVVERLDDLHDQIGHYKASIARLSMEREHAVELREASRNAHDIGRSAMQKIEGMAAGVAGAHQGDQCFLPLLLNLQKAEIARSAQRFRPEAGPELRKYLFRLKETMNGCAGCHHAAPALFQIEDLRKAIGEYRRAAGRLLPDPAGFQRFRTTRVDTHLLGDSLVNKVEIMVVGTSEKMREQTEASLRKAQAMKKVMIILIAAGPFAMIIFALVMARGVTRPIGALLQATRSLKRGNLEHRVAKLPDEFGELAVAFNDMTRALGASLDAVEESEKKYRLLFESAADAIFILDGEGPETGRILRANQAAARMHGYRVEELTGMKVQDLDCPEAAVAASGRLQRISQGEWLKFEINHRRKDGTEFPVEVSAGMFNVDRHKFILAVDRDISERKRAELDLQRAERIKISGALATGLAHEIKNPLAGIKVSMEVLSEESYLKDEDREVLNKVIGEIRRIEYLMKELMNFTHPPKPHLMNTDVNEVLEIIAGMVRKETARTRPPGRAVRIVSDLAQGLPEIMADPMQLKQVFMNLILNGVEAMPEGGTLTLRSTGGPEENIVKIELSDTGSGMEPDVLASAFSPFFTTKAKGTGLGLSITKRLVEENGGAIFFRNNAGGGVTCTVTFPAKEEKGALTE